MSLYNSFQFNALVFNALLLEKRISIFKFGIIKVIIGNIMDYLFYKIGYSIRHVLIMLLLFH